jgi:hypothetical protein
MFNQQLRTGILEDLYKKNEEVIKDKDDQITMLEKEVIRYRSQESESGDISKELKVEHANVTEFSLMYTPIHNLQEGKTDTIFLAYARFIRRPSNSEVKRIEEWLKVRTKAKVLKLVVQ